MRLTMEVLNRLPQLFCRSIRLRNLSSIVCSSRIDTRLTASLLDSRSSQRIGRSHFACNFSSSSVRDADEKLENSVNLQDEDELHHRIWKPRSPSEVWHQRFIDREDEDTLLRKIEEEEFAGARMKSRHLGVLNEDAATDMELLTQNYSATSLASAVSPSLFEVAFHSLPLSFLTLPVE